MNQLTHIRKCSVCGLNFSKPTNYSMAQWVQVLTYSKDCTHISALRKKREYAKEVHDKYESYRRKNVKRLTTA